MNQIPGLANIMATLRAHATSDATGELIVVNPWQVLREAGLDSEALGALVQLQHLKKKGGVSYAIISRVGESLPEPTPPPTTLTPLPTSIAPLSEPRSWVVVIDANNVYRIHADAGVPLRPGHLQRQLVRRHPIATTFAIGNYDAIPWEGRKAFAEAGFPIGFHCDALHGTKDMVDPSLITYVLDFLQMLRRDVVAGVILVSDDGNFIPLARRVLDQQWQCAAATFRHRAPLARMDGVQRIVLTLPEEIEEETRRWNPADIMGDLERLLGTTPRAQEEALLRIQLRAPFVERVLRHFFSHLHRQHNGNPEFGFDRHLRELLRSIPREEQSAVTEDDRRALLNLLIRIKILIPCNAPHPRGEGVYTGYRVDWTHPFCVHALKTTQAKQRRSSAPPTLVAAQK